MGTLVIYLAICILPTAALYCASKALQWFSSYDRLAPRTGMPRDQPSLQRLVADLQRLEQEYRRLERSDAPAKVQRMRAVSLAYDDVLGESCIALDLPLPTERPLSAFNRLEAEMELARHGLMW